MKQPNRAVTNYEGVIPKGAISISWGQGIYIWTHSSFMFSEIDEDGEEYSTAGMSYVVVVCTRGTGCFIVRQKHLKTFLELLTTES
jgi:hypothetical protein